MSDLTRAQKVFTMLGALLGMLLAALDQTIVATAGPAIQKDLGMDAALYVWITTAYLVASTVLVPVWGKLSDLYGRKPTLVAGIVVFLVGSLACGLAQTSLQLICFRAVQGVGSAALFTNAFAVVADLFPPAERGKWQGLFGSVFGLASVVGPLVGGFLTDTVGWHWTFFVNLPVGAIALGFVLARMPRLGGHGDGPRPRIDVAGALALTVAVVPLLLALSFGEVEGAPGGVGWPWLSWQIASLFALAVVGTIAFLAIEGRAASPILDLRLFADRAFAYGVAATFTTGATFLAAIVFLPLFMVNVVGLSATDTGLTTTPLTFGIVAANIAVGQLVSRVGGLKLFIAGSLVVLAVGFAVMAFTLSPSATQGAMTLKMFLVGVGLGPSIPLFTLAIQNAVPPRAIGVATSSATFFRQMGATIGVAVLGTVFATTLAQGMRDRVGVAQAFTDATARVYFVAIFVVAVALVLVARMPVAPLRPRA